MHKVVFTLVFYLLSLTTIAQVKWSLAKEKDDIRVYTSEGGASKFKAIKVKAELSGTLDRLIDLLTDASANKEWIYKTKESYTLKRVSTNQTLSYTETSVPWPASNRDIALQMDINFEAKTRTLKVTAVGVPNVIPEKKGIVRIPYFNSYWNVQADGSGRLKIYYFLEMDPGGSVPAWISNLFVAKGPFETFSKLAIMLKR